MTDFRYTYNEHWDDKTQRPAPAIIHVPEDQPVMRAIQAWSKYTFKKSTPLSTLVHLKREITEIEREMLDGNVHGLGDELADAVHLLCQLARMYNLDLDTEVRSKFERNQLRSWKEPDDDGVVEHVKESPDFTTNLFIDGEPATKYETGYVDHTAQILAKNNAVRRSAKVTLSDQIRDYFIAHPMENVTYRQLEDATGAVDPSRECRKLKERGMSLVRIRGGMRYEPKR